MTGQVLPIRLRMPLYTLGESIRFSVENVTIQALNPAR